MKVLIDSSAWIHFLRPDGDEAVRDRVRSALLTGQACWCPMVRLELWNGARGDKEKQVLKEFEADLIELPMPAEVWELAFDKARRARASGLTVPATEALVFGHPPYERYNAALAALGIDISQLSAGGHA